MESLFLQLCTYKGILGARNGKGSILRLAMYFIVLFYIKDRSILDAYVQIQGYHVYKPKHNQACKLLQ